MKKCLVVDDVEVTRFIVEQIVTSLGMGILAVATPEEATEILHKHAIDVVILDWHLRKSSGIDLLKNIKASLGTSVKVIVFSGVEGSDKETEARHAGADAFMEKPTTKENLEKCLKNLGVL